MGLSKNGGTNRCFILDNPIKIIWGYPYFRKPPCVNMYTHPPGPACVNVLAPTLAPQPPQRMWRCRSSAVARCPAASATALPGAAPLTATVGISGRPAKSGENLRIYHWNWGFTRKWHEITRNLHEFTMTYWKLRDYETCWYLVSIVNDIQWHSMTIWGTVVLRSFPSHLSTYVLQGKNHQQNSQEAHSSLHSKEEST